MIRIAKVLSFVLVGLIGLVVLTAGAARVGDGPLGPLPGGAFEAGSAAGPDEFRPPLIRDGRWELEVNGTSRTVAMFVVGERLFAIRPALATPYGWSQQAIREHEAALRIDGRIFAVRLARLAESDVRDHGLRSVFYEKLPRPQFAEDPDTWFFEIVPTR